MIADGGRIEHDDVGIGAFLQASFAARCDGGGLEADDGRADDASDDAGSITAVQCLKSKPSDTFNDCLRRMLDLDPLEAAGRTQPPDTQPRDIGDLVDFVVGKALDVLGESFVELKLLPSKPDMSKLITEEFLPK